MDDDALLRNALFTARSFTQLLGGDACGRILGRMNEVLECLAENEDASNASSELQSILASHELGRNSTHLEPVLLNFGRAFLGVMGAVSSTNDVTLKNALMTTRSFSMLLANDACGRLLSLMNEVLWCAVEKEDSSSSLVNLKDALSNTPLTRHSTQLELVVINFTQSFHIIAKRKWVGVEQKPIPSLAPEQNAPPAESADRKGGIKLPLSEPAQKPPVIVPPEVPSERESISPPHAPENHATLTEEETEPADDTTSPVPQPDPVQHFEPPSRASSMCPEIHGRIPIAMRTSDDCTISAFLTNGPEVKMEEPEFDSAENVEEMLSVREGMQSSADNALFDMTIAAGTSFDSELQQPDEKARLISFGQSDGNLDQSADEQMADGNEEEAEEEDEDGENEQENQDDDEDYTPAAKISRLFGRANLRSSLATPKAEAKTPVLKHKTPSSSASTRRRGRPRIPKGSLPPPTPRDDTMGASSPSSSISDLFTPKEEPTSAPRARPKTSKIFLDGGKCPFCPKILATKTGSTTLTTLSDHFSYKHKDLPGTFFRCSLCPDVLKRARENFYTHIRECGGEVEFHYDEKGFTRHRNTAWFDEDECPECKEVLAASDGEGISIKGLSEHFKKNHRDVAGTFFRCSACPSQKGRGLSSIYPHIKSSNCGGQPEYHRDAVAQSCARNRVALIDADDCPICNEALAQRPGEGISARAMMEHLSSAHSKDPGTFLRCAICRDVKSRDTSKLYTHFKLADCGGRIEFDHDRCGVSVSIRGNKIVTLTEETCPFCDKVFRVSGDEDHLARLSEHLTSSHRDIPGSFYRCSECTNFHSRSKYQTFMHARTSHCGGKVQFHHNPNFAMKPTMHDHIPEDRCPVCDEFLSSYPGEGTTLSKLSEHLNREHNDLPGTFFRCSSCAEVQTRTRLKIYEHLKSADCSGRPEYFHDETGAAAVAPTTSRYVAFLAADECPLCAENLSTAPGAGILQSHLNSHFAKSHQDTPGTFFRCSVCPDFKYRAQIKQYEHNRNGCGGSIQFLYDKDATPSHVVMAKKRSERELTMPHDACPICGEVLAANAGEGCSQSKFIAHISSTHNALPGSFYRCSQCPDAKFRSKWKHYEHTKSDDCEGKLEFHHDEKFQLPATNRFIPVIKEDRCPFCDELLAMNVGEGVSFSRLSEHFASCHEDLPGTFFRCAECQDFKYRTVGKKIEHSKDDACGGKPEFFHDPHAETTRKRFIILPEQDTCPFCDESLCAFVGDGIALTDLTDHLKTSHRDKPGTFFRCSECPDAQFRSKTKFSEHLRKESCAGKIEYYYDEEACELGQVKAEYTPEDKCPFCDAIVCANPGEGFVMSRLADHLQSEHKDIAGTFFRCSSCPDSRHRSRGAHYDHMKASNCGGKVEYHFNPNGTVSRGAVFLQQDVCPLCPDVIAVAPGAGIIFSRLAEHLSKKHHDTPGTFFRCSICTNTRVRDRTLLQKHLKHEECGGKFEYFHDPNPTKNKRLSMR